MRTVTYQRIKELAGQLAGREPAKLPTAEAAMLRTFCAAHLDELWRREAWPELCDHLEAVTLDAAQCFSLREGDGDEIGDVLWLGDADPRTSPTATRLNVWTRLNNRVHVATTLATIWVDWQTPVPDLLAADLDASAALNAYPLPERFRLMLAYLGAAALQAEAEPGQAALFRAAAAAELARQAQPGQLSVPWWRRS